MEETRNTGKQQSLAMGEKVWGRSLISSVEDKRSKTLDLKPVEVK